MNIHVTLNKPVLNFSTISMSMDRMQFLICYGSTICKEINYDYVVNRNIYNNCKIKEA